jgi:acetoin utilization protein AcuC
MGDVMPQGGQVWWRSWALGFDPDDPVDLAVMATREAVFPLHGLDVWFD